VKAIEAIAREVGKGSHDRHSMAKALGYKSGVGLAARKVAALVQYGLLKRAPKGRYEPTELADALLHPRTDTEYTETLTRAFESPALFFDLLQRFRDDGRIPNQLANILVRDHGITRDASETAAKSFIESARFAGAIDENNDFVAGGADDADLENEDDVDERLLDEDNEPPEQVAIKNEQGPKLRIPGGRRTYPLSVAGGEAHLVVPTPLSGADLAKLRQGVDLILKLLELDVGEGEQVSDA